MTAFVENKFSCCQEFPLINQTFVWFVIMFFFYFLNKGKKNAGIFDAKNVYKSNMRYICQSSKKKKKNQFWWVCIKKKKRRQNWIWFLLCSVLCCFTRMTSDSNNKNLSSCLIEPAMNKITGSLLELTIRVFLKVSFFIYWLFLATSTSWLSIYIPINHYHKNWTTVR